MELQRRWPLIATILVLINTAVLFNLAGERPIDSDTLARYWIYLEPYALWEGKRWSLLGAAFTHLPSAAGTFQFLFNTMLLWLLASRVEWAIGREALTIVVIFGAVLTSGVQAATGQWPVLGADGVVYTLFGLSWAARQHGILALGFSRPQRWMLAGCFVLGILAGFLGLWPGGSVAPLAGFALGTAIAWLVYERRWRVGAGAILAGLVALTACALFWAPWLKDGHIAQAKAQVGRLEHREDPIMLNGLAWMLATVPADAARDGHKALTLAVRAVGLTHGADPGILDTLAAAHAELGHWDEALAIERRIIAQIKPTDPQRQIGPDEKALFQSNLAHFERHQPLREWPF
jgi:membrane associated rhomboid family serine protease